MILETERLALRELDQSDFAALRVRLPEPGHGGGLFHHP